MFGWIIVNKPAGITSMEVTRRIKRLIGDKTLKYGHAGTLDPFADGILPIAIGKATSLIPFLMQKHKVYTFVLEWGTQTTTDDLEGETIAMDEKIPNSAEINAILPSFIGNIKQTPSPYCAIKIKGKSAYKRIRAGEHIEIPERIVKIKELLLLEQFPTAAKFQVKCASGTYVRALARDIANALETKGHLIQLCRTEVGPFRIQNSNRLDLLEKMDHTLIERVLLSPNIVLDDILVCSVIEEEKNALWQGKKIKFSASSTKKEEIVGCYWNNDLVALGKLNEDNITPFRCFINLERKK